MQALHPRLLNDLAQEFAAAKFDLKWLMRQFVNSRGYQLSARYDGVWKAEGERLYARKLVRCLWAEELHDAVAQSCGIVPTLYHQQTAADQLRDAISRNVRHACGDDSIWCDGSADSAHRAAASIGVCDELPGQLFARRQCHESRDDEARINQALELFNNKFVLERVKASNPDGILAKSLSLTDEQLVNKLFAAVLSRPSSESEKNLVLSNLKKGSRTEQAENLLWTLYNKVDFIYNY